MFEISRDTSSSFIVPNEPFMVNVPLLGLGTSVMSSFVDIDLTPTLVTSIIVEPEPSVLQISLAVTMHATVSVVVKLFVKVAVVAPATMLPFISHW